MRKPRGELVRREREQVGVGARGLAVVLEVIQKVRSVEQQCDQIRVARGGLVDRRLEIERHLVRCQRAAQHLLAEGLNERRHAGDVIRCVRIGRAAAGERGQAAGRSRHLRRDVQTDVVERVDVRLRDVALHAREPNARIEIGRNVGEVARDRAHHRGGISGRQRARDEIGDRIHVLGLAEPRHRRRARAHRRVAGERERRFGRLRGSRRGSTAGGAGHGPDDLGLAGGQGQQQHPLHSTHGVHRQLLCPV